MIPSSRRWRVTFKYREGHRVIKAAEWVYAPTKQLALWAAREQRHGCIIADPDVVQETISLARDNGRGLVSAISNDGV